MQNKNLYSLIFISILKEGKYVDVALIAKSD